jgi:type IV pilus assembly protein PilA
VTEGLVLGSSLKVVVADNAANATVDASGGYFGGLPSGTAAAPTSCSAAGTCGMQVSAAGKDLTKNVTSITGTTTNGLITVAYTSAIAASTANKIELWPTSNAAVLVVATPPASSIVWTCYTLGKTVAGTGVTNGATLLPKYAPAECR